MTVAPTSTPTRGLDEAVARLREAAPRWAAASLPARIALARSMLRGVERNAERLVREGCAAKGLPLDAAAAGDEWLAAAYVTVRILRQIVRSLAMLARNGNTPVGPTFETADGRLASRVFPHGLLDRALFAGVSGEVHFLEGVTEERMHERRARFHRAPDHAGKVCLVLGAGNVNSIAATDVATKLFNEGKVCVLKVNPVNAYVGPILEDAFSEAITAGVLSIAYGGAEEGGHLAHHPGVDEVHVTGSGATHDRIVWGPPGPEREERKAAGRPLLRKEITSELGDVAPVLVAPGPWDERALAFQAESVAGMITQNASFNCVAAQVLVLPRGWRERDRFLGLVERALFGTAPRRAWYPGASDRFRRLTGGRPSVRSSPGGGEGTLPWAIVPGLDAAAEDDLFRVEAFCSLVAETQVGSEDPAEFLDAAVSFANDRLWGTLSANLVVPSAVLADGALRPALEKAVRRLRYGTVAVNTWAGYGFGFGTAPWGAFPGQPLADPRSGRGFVHNTLMLEETEKTVIRHPARVPIKPPYFPSHRTAHVLGRRIVALEARRRWFGLPGVVAAALRG